MQSVLSLLQACAFRACAAAAARPELHASCTGGLHGRSHSQWQLTAHSAPVHRNTDAALAAQASAVRACAAAAAKPGLPQPSTRGLHGRSHSQRQLPGQHGSRAAPHTTRSWGPDQPSASRATSQAAAAAGHDAQVGRMPVFCLSIKGPGSAVSVCHHMQLSAAGLPRLPPPKQQPLREMMRRCAASQCSVCIQMIRLCWLGSIRQLSAVCSSWNTSHASEAAAAAGHDVQVSLLVGWAQAGRPALVQLSACADARDSSRCHEQCKHAGGRCRRGAC